MNSKGRKRKNQAQITNIFEQQQMIAKVEEIRGYLKPYTWHDLETAGKFDKNQKLSFISNDMLIVGCDIGSETHFVRGRELSKSAFSFSNTEEGFTDAREWH